MKRKNLTSLYILAEPFILIYCIFKNFFKLSIFGQFLQNTIQFATKKIARKRKGYCHHIKPPTKTSSFIFLFDNIIIHKMEQTQHEK